MAPFHRRGASTNASSLQKAWTTSRFKAVWFLSGCFFTLFLNNTPLFLFLDDTTPSTASLLATVSSFDDFNATQASPLTTSTVLSKQRHSKNIAYHLEPERFIEGLANCMLDAWDKKSPRRCNLMFQHQYKSGGTTIEYIFYKLYGMKDLSGFGCCQEDMLKRFYDNPRLYCQRKFQSYEVIDGFDGMVHKCQDSFYRFWHNHTVIVLTSMREPTSRTLSRIHHTCNKNWDLRSEETKAKCTTCKYEDDPDYWMTYPADINKNAETVRNQTMGSLKGFDHYWIDNMDLTPMLKDLFDFLSSRHPLDSDVLESTRERQINTEKLDKCSFGLTSEMVKELTPARTLYKQFLQGSMWEP